MQFEAVKYEAIFSSQFGGIIQRSMEDTGVFLTHLIRTGWDKKLRISVLAFNFSQFFPSLNHLLLLDILKKQGFAPEIVSFFSNYLIEQSTTYLYNSFSSSHFDFNTGVGQGFTFSPILLGLYL